MADTDKIRLLSASQLPVYADLTISKGIPSGSGPAFADGAFDAEPFVAFGASKGYAPMVKPGRVSPGGYGARMRDGLFDESLYRLRAVGEGIFGALTMEFGDRMRTGRKESSETRILLRLLVYCLKVVARWLHG